MYKFDPSLEPTDHLNAISLAAYNLIVENDEAYFDWMQKALKITGNFADISTFANEIEADFVAQAGDTHMKDFIVAATRQVEWIEVAAQVRADALVTFSLGGAQVKFD